MLSRNLLGVFGPAFMVLRQMSGWVMAPTKTRALQNEVSSTCLKKASLGFFLIW